jgi:hypothetical protein
MLTPVLQLADVAGVDVPTYGRVASNVLATG